MREMCVAFHGIIDQISRVGQQLPPLESWVNMKSDCEHIKVILPEWYLEQTHRQLAHVLQTTFEPITNYVKKLYDKFEVVFGAQMHSDIVAYVSTGRSFQECAMKVEDFNRFIGEINGMVNYTY